MKFNFKQISAVMATVMLGITGIAGAMAANFPRPFVTGTTGNFAVVYGSDAATSDQTQATSIAEQLQSMVSTASLGEEYYKFEKTSTKYHLGDNITGVISSSIDDDELPTLLAEGKYIDDDNDEFDYTQKIDIGPNLQLNMWEDNDYAEDEPTVGFKIPNGVTVLNYTLDFSDEPLIADLTSTNLPLMGKTYYILSNSSSGANLKLTLLDSADSAVVSEAETKTVSGHDVSISFISSTEVKLDIDGETTNTLEEGETQKLSDGSYIGIKDIMYVSKDTGISSVEISIGTGKLLLTSGSEIQINDEAQSGITAYLTNSTAALNTATVTLDKIVIKWAADEDTFITETTSATMPGFEIVKLAYEGLDYPAEETIVIQQGGDSYAVLENFPLKDSTEDIAFLYGTSNSSSQFVGIGKDSDELLVTARHGAGTQNITFDSDSDKYFVASWSDGSDAESYLMRATNFVLDGSNNETDIQYKKNGDWTNAKAGAQATDTFSIGNVELGVGWIDRAGHQVYIWNNSANTGLNGTLWSKEGMKVHLPAAALNDSVVPGAINLTQTSGNTTTGHNGTSFYLVAFEEDENENKGDGDWINATVGWDSSTSKEVEVTTYATTNTDATKTEIDDTDVWRDFVYSALATEILSNEPSSGQKSLKLVYHGAEVAAGVYISSPEAAGEVDLGNVLVTDSEISAVQGKNLIVVGGSAVNTVAAELIGVTYPTKTDAWTAATGVGTGQLLIQSFNSPYQTGKVAVLVAGYEAADTTAGAQRLINQPSTIDTTVGNKYVYQTGTSGTSTLVSGP